MSNESETHDLWLDQVRANAVKIQALIDSEFPDLTDVRYWRALYRRWSSDVNQFETIAATIGQQKNQPPFAQVQLRYFHNVGGPRSPNGASYTAQRITGVGITATEMAVFLGLDGVDPADVEWVAQQVPGGGIAIARAGIDLVTSV